MYSSITLGSLRIGIPIKRSDYNVQNKCILSKYAMRGPEDYPNPILYFADWVGCCYKISCYACKLYYASESFKICIMED